MNRLKYLRAAAWIRTRMQHCPDIEWVADIGTHWVYGYWEEQRLCIESYPKH